MRTEDCRPWREDIGSFVLGHLDDPRERAVRVHLEICADCRSEVDQLGRVAALLPAVDRRIAQARLVLHRPRRRTVRVIATATVVMIVMCAGLVVGLLRHATSSDRLAFLAATPGAHAAGSASSRPWGMRIEIRATGLTPQATYRVWCERGDGVVEPAGRFQASPRGTTDVVLTTAVRYSTWKSVFVERADGRTVLRALHDEG